MCIDWCVLNNVYWLMCVEQCVLTGVCWIMCIDWCVLNNVYWLACVDRCVLTKMVRECVLTNACWLMCECISYYKTWKCSIERDRSSLLWTTVCDDEVCVKYGEMWWLLYSTAGPQLVLFYYNGYCLCPRLSASESTLSQVMHMIFKAANHCLLATMPRAIAWNGTSFSHL